MLKYGMAIARDHTQQYCRGQITESMVLHPD
jgi:hypothetical protein